MTDKIFSAKDVLLYLFSDCVSWNEDVDGDAHDDGRPFAIVRHDIRLKESHLDELLDMAGIEGRPMDSALDRLKRANDEYLADIPEGNP